MSPVYRPSDFRRIALRATGGKVKAIFWHLGVRCALEERGFRFATGFGPHQDGNRGEIGLLVGSSAGSVFSILLAAGYDVPEILASFIGRQSRLPPINEATIFHRRDSALKGYFRRIRNAVNLRASAELFPGSGVSALEDLPTADESESLPIEAPPALTLGKLVRHFRMTDLLVVRARYTLEGMERWFRELLGGRDRFEDLRPLLYILASDLDFPMTAVFGERRQDCVWYKYIAGLPVSRAGAASMAIPSIFNPVPIEVEGRKHYFIDGDVYNPTEPVVERDHGCDLAIVSSFEAPYRFHPAIGSLHHLGLPYELTQTIALAVYSRLIQSRNMARAKAAGLAAARDALAPHLEEESLERECRRIAAALDMSMEMKVLHLHPFKNPLLFFENPFDLSSRTLGKMIVEASLQAGELLDREGFTSASP
ncbi:MAG TPA: patatin-like phospholipase family protein [Thermoanaerobaculia bacterium]|nr:patatin-like phospholipase family protein [Thermoanaerobaculia bacterium]